MFEDTQKKILYAESLLEKISRDFDEFVRSSPIEITMLPPDNDLGGVMYCGRLTKPLPRYFDREAFNAIGELRSSLDLLVSDLCSQTAANPRHCGFPFSNTMQNVDAALKSRQINFLPLETQEKFRRLKLYPEGNRLLWALNKLCNEDKHRRIRTIGNTVYPAKIDGSGILQLVTAFNIPMEYGKEPVPISQIKVIGDVNIQFLCDIFFESIEEFDQMPVLELVKSFVRECRSVVGIFSDGTP